MCSTALSSSLETSDVTMETAWHPLPPLQHPWEGARWIFHPPYPGFIQPQTGYTMYIVKPAAGWARLGFARRYLVNRRRLALRRGSQRVTYSHRRLIETGSGASSRWNNRLAAWWHLNAPVDNLPDNLGEFSEESGEIITVVTASNRPSPGVSTLPPPS